MDEEPQEVTPEKSEENNKPDNISGFEAFREKRQSQNQKPTDEVGNISDSKARERLNRIRELIEMAKKIKAEQASAELTSDQREILNKLREEYSKDHGTISLEEAVNRDFTPEQVDQLKALREIYKEEKEWQHGDQVLAIRDEFYKEATSGNERFVTNHLPTGSEIVGSIKPWEGEGEIVVVSYENSSGSETKPGSVQIVYKVKAPVGNNINHGNINEKRLTITIRNPRNNSSQNDGRLYILSREINPETNEETFRQFDSENPEPLKEGDMNQEEAMATLKQVVDAYKDSTWGEEQAQEQQKAA